MCGKRYLPCRYSLQSSMFQSTSVQRYHASHIHTTHTLIHSPTHNTSTSTDVILCEINLTGNSVTCITGYPQKPWPFSPLCVSQFLRSHCALPGFQNRTAPRTSCKRTQPHNTKTKDSLHTSFPSHLTSAISLGSLQAISSPKVSAVAV